MIDTTPVATADRLADAPVNLLELERQVCFALTVASRGVIAVYRPLLEPLRLTHPQYLVMLALWQYAPLTLTELGEHLQLDPATLSPLLERLGATGYCTRLRDPDNERALRLSLTEAGTGLRDQALATPEAVMARLGLDLAEADELHGILSSVIERSHRPVRR